MIELMNYNYAKLSIIEQLRRSPRVREVESSFPKSRPNLTQFATASTLKQVAVLPWRYDVEMGSANS